MQLKIGIRDNRDKAPGRALALLGSLLLAAAPSLHAATPEPLPPPPELLDSGGYAIDGARGANVYQYPNYPEYQGAASINRYSAPGYVPPRQPISTPADAPYDPYATPASSYLPPLPGQPAPEVGAPYAAGQARQPAFAPPAIQAPPMANLPYSPAPDGQFRASPPAIHMPDDYFNLPMNHQEEIIPGVLMPTVNEDFYDPAFVPPARRVIRAGMSPRQLEPFFEEAKGYEKAALDAKKTNDDYRYHDALQKAIAGYMEIIAMADAGHEAREEAWYGVARCEYRRENWWKSFDAIERSFPREFDRKEVAGRIKLEMYIGERLWRMGHTPAPDARKDGGLLSGYQAASRVYAAAIFNQPNSIDAPLALLRRGDAAAMEEDWEAAARFYRSVVQYYPDSEPAMQARSSLAEAVYRQEWPAGLPELARQDLNMMMVEVEGTERKLSLPAEDRRQRAAILANNHDAEIKLRQAKAYISKIRVKKSRDAAVFQLGEIVSHFPNTPQAREAADLLLGMGIEPPMILAEGNRYPIAGGMDELEIDRTQGSGAARVGRQNEAGPPPRQGGAPFSPAPTGSAYPDPANVYIPGVASEWE